ncbi:MAG: ABC transporter ATP-binding protein [Anaerolineaceae bacterium]|nr:ABC transporter ATP-binding protein [Anaerolineaceae bacterium]
MGNNVNGKPVLEVNDLKVAFDTYEGKVHAVNGISITLGEKESLAIVGESGCGKSASMYAVLRLHDESYTEIEANYVNFLGHNLMDLSQNEMRAIRGKDIAMIFQDSMTAFNPVRTIGYQICEALNIHFGLAKQEARTRAIELLSMVGIPDAAKRVDDYPHQFSGGMRQRAMIAMALACDPKILIADEPTTALDVTIQAQIIDLVKNLKEELDMSVIWVTHDLGVVANIADRVNVMYAGYIVESGKVDDVFKDPRHPYTLGLMGSLPKFDETTKERKKLVSIPGIPPVLYGEANICPFAPRCTFRTEQCLQNPPLLSVGGSSDHQVACWIDVSERKEVEPA